ncbi:Phosphoribulokinase / Uridine kinase family [Musa troglodytarum]|uniref:Phosphoribulokinase / Uridine kinase family n=1 Tax=Musa troglodytarum TaxID=320322 RepID=A0A9E7KGR0_9LILI|nr:Phosphoribulokinase / Uridine kinase family [Musa troglodytarum]
MISSFAVARLGCNPPDSLVLRRNHANSHYFLVSNFSPPRGILKQILCRSLSFTQKHSNQKVLCYHKQEFPVLSERSIEEVYDSLTERLLSSAAKVQDINSKYIVGLAGPPGAGKTTLSSEVVHRLNNLWSQKVTGKNSVSPLEFAIVLPMDGFHLYRSQLDAMEGSTYAPSFDHGVGDPVEDDVFVSSEFLDIDINIAMERVLKRHISTGKKPDVAKWRIEYNDRPNAELIMGSKKNADIFRSLNFQLSQNYFYTSSEKSDVTQIVTS